MAFTVYEQDRNDVFRRLQGRAAVGICCELRTEKNSRTGMRENRYILDHAFSLVRLRLLPQDGFEPWIFELLIPISRDSTASIHHARFEGFYLWSDYVVIFPDLSNLEMIRRRCRGIAKGIQALKIRYSTRWSRVRFDDQGRVVDEDGEEFDATSTDFGLTCASFVALLYGPPPDRGLATGMVDPVEWKWNQSDAAFTVLDAACASLLCREDRAATMDECVSIRPEVYRTLMKHFGLKLGVEHNDRHHVMSRTSGRENP